MYPMATIIEAQQLVMGVGGQDGLCGAKVPHENLVSDSLI